MSDSPFKDFTDLPCDVAEALEQFKLSIIRHRSMHYSEIQRVKLTRIFLALIEFNEECQVNTANNPGIGEFSDLLDRYIKEHPEEHVRFAARMIKRDFDKMVTKLQG